MVAVPVGVPEMMFPVTLNPAGNPCTQTVASGDAVIVERNGRPTVPEAIDAVRVGTGQGTMVMVVVAVAPHAAVAVIVAVPEAAGVPEMMLPLSVRPVGRPVAVIVAPGAAMTVERNGSPTVPMSVSATIVGAAHGAMARLRVACAPHAAVTVTVAVPEAVGVPEMMFPLSVRPAGS